MRCVRDMDQKSKELTWGTPKTRCATGVPLLRRELSSMSSIISDALWSFCVMSDTALMIVSSTFSHWLNAAIIRGRIPLPGSCPMYVNGSMRTCMCRGGCQRSAASHRRGFQLMDAGRGLPIRTGKHGRTRHLGFFLFKTTQCPQHPGLFLLHCSRFLCQLRGSLQCTPSTTLPLLPASTSSQSPPGERKRLAPS